MRLTIRPAKPALALVSIWLMVALVTGLLRIFGYQEAAQISSAWLAISALLLLVLLLDWRSARKAKANALFAIKRQSPGTLSIGKPQAVHLQITNNSSHPQSLELIEHLPANFQLQESMPFNVNLQAGESSNIRYHIIATERGATAFELTELRYRSRWNLWEIKQHIDNPQALKVYPDFMAIAHLDTMHDQHQSMQLGVHQKQRRGQGTDFKQLRDYHDGDALKDVDWKASSRYRKLITREYQDERDQEVLFLLDCGRSMRSKDDNLSHFDHCLNALLLSSYVALRHGDSVSTMAFAGQRRFLNAVKGQQNINRILNGVYDLQSTLHTADYVQAAKDLLSQQRKRALIIIITNINTDARDDLLAATRLLSQHHLVMVASIQEPALKQSIQTPVSHLDDALRYCTAIANVNQRQQLLLQLKNEGITIVDSQAQQLHTGLLNEYTALKRSGRF